MDCSNLEITLESGLSCFVQPIDRHRFSGYSMVRYKQETIVRRDVHVGLKSAFSAIDPSELGISLTRFQSFDVEKIDVVFIGNDEHLPVMRQHHSDGTSQRDRAFQGELAAAPANDCHAG